MSPRVGDRVEIHPRLDRWMRGDRYGCVTAVLRSGKVRVHMDKSEADVRLATDDIHRIV